MGAIGRHFASPIGINRNHPAFPGLIGAWAMRPNVAGIRDLTGKGKDGVRATDAPSPIVTPYGFGYSFDGSNDSFVCGGTGQLPQLPVTIGFLFNPNDLTGFHSIIAVGTLIIGTAGYGIQAATNGASLYTVFWDGTGQTSSSSRSLTTTNTVSIGSWYMVFAQLGGATDIKIMVNGVDWTGTPGGSGGALAYAATSKFRIGRRNEPSDEVMFNGKLAVVYVWNRKLPDRIKQMLTTAPMGLLRTSSLPIGSPQFLLALNATTNFSLSSSGNFSGFFNASGGFSASGSALASAPSSSVRRFNSWTGMRTLDFPTHTNRRLDEKIGGMLFIRDLRKYVLDGNNLYVKYGYGTTISSKAFEASGGFEIGGSANLTV